jgi:hypothetical protein
MSYEEKNAEIEIAGPGVKQSSELDDPKAAGPRVGREQEHQSGTDSQCDADAVPSCPQTRDGELYSADEAPDGSSEATADFSRQIDNAKDERQVQALEPIASKFAHSPGEPARAFPGLERDMLLLDQMIGTSQGTRLDEKLRFERACGAMDLYQSFNPSDATESALARVAVALTNASMDCLDRAASPQQTAGAREIELKLGVKLASSLAEVLTLMDKHRGLGRQNVNVGSVNVESGANAIVGNVQSPKHEEKPTVVPSERPTTEDES